MVPLACFLYTNDCITPILLYAPAQAVQFNCDSFRESCVSLVAEGFPLSFSRATDGLPTEVG
jgi:hypothetical protein